MIMKKFIIIMWWLFLLNSFLWLNNAAFAGDPDTKSETLNSDKGIPFIDPLEEYLEETKSLKTKSKSKSKSKSSSKKSSSKKSSSKKKTTKKKSTKKEIMKISLNLKFIN